MVAASPQHIPTRIAFRIPVSHLNHTVTSTNLVQIPLVSFTNPQSQSQLSLPLKSSTFKDRTGLEIIHLNVRSLYQKLDQVEIFALQTAPDILVLSESQLKGSVSDSDIASSGYNVFRVDRVGKGGGVVVYVKSNISVTVLESVTKPKCFEFISLRVHLGPTSMVVAGIYRPPSGVKDSVEALGDLIAQYTKNGIIITGDFNLKWFNSISDHLKEVSEKLNLTQLLVNPTRPDLKDSSKSTLIDLIFTNKVDKIVASVVSELGFSDHCYSTCIRSTHLEKTKAHVVMRRNLKHFNKQSFMADIAHSDISSTSKFNDQSALDFFTETFKAVVHVHAPLKRI